MNIKLWLLKTTDLNYDDTHFLDIKIRIYQTGISPTLTSNSTDLYNNKNNLKLLRLTAILNIIYHEYE